MRDPTNTVSSCKKNLQRFFEGKNTFKHNKREPTRNKKLRLVSVHTISPLEWKNRTLKYVLSLRHGFVDWRSPQNTLPSD